MSRIFSAYINCVLPSFLIEVVAELWREGRQMLNWCAHPDGSCRLYPSGLIRVYP